MTGRFDEYNHVLRLEKGELLVASLLGYARQQDVTSGWVMGLGGALWAELGCYDLETREYKWKKLDQLLEITSLQGNFAQDDQGETMLHLHGSFSDTDMQAYGGHIKELAVAATCEVFIHGWFDKEPLRRTLDDEIGLKLLDL